MESSVIMDIFTLLTKGQYVDRITLERLEEALSTFTNTLYRNGHLEKSIWLWNQAITLTKRSSTLLLHSYAR